MPDHPYPTGAPFGDSATAYGLRMMSRYVANYHPPDDAIRERAHDLAETHGAQEEMLVEHGIWLRGDLQEHGSEPLQTLLIPGSLPLPP